MDVPEWIKGVADAGGWAAFASLSVAVILALIMGKLHSDGELQREIKAREKAEAARDKEGERVDSLTVALREQNTSTARMAQSMEFIEDFVRDIIRERIGNQSGAGRQDGPRTRTRG